jgi:hypothetical protein
MRAQVALHGVDVDDQGRCVDGADRLAYQPLERLQKEVFSSAALSSMIQVLRVGPADQREALRGSRANG